MRDGEFTEKLVACIEAEKAFGQKCWGVSLHIYGSEVETLIVSCVVFERTIIIKG